MTLSPLSKYTVRRTTSSTWNCCGRSPKRTRGSARTPHAVRSSFVLPGRTSVRERISPTKRTVDPTTTPWPSTNKAPDSLTFRFRWWLGRHCDRELGIENPSTRPSPFAQDLWEQTDKFLRTVVAAPDSLSRSVTHPVLVRDRTEPA